MKKDFLCFGNPCNAVYFCLTVLLLVGCVNVYSASFVYALGNGVAAYHYLLRYVIFALMSLSALWITRKLGYRFFLQEPILKIFGMVVLALLVAVLLFADPVNDARRWLNFGYFNVQPSELAKLFVVMMCSSLLGKRLAQGLRVNLFGLSGGFCLLVSVALGLLIKIEPDTGTAAIVVALCIILCLAAGALLIQILVIGCSLSLVIGVAIYYTSYQLSRIKLWLNPWSDPLGAGYQMVQSQIAVGSGGWLGMPWGAGTAKFYFLPELHTDFAFAIFCQENGFLGALFLICLFCLLGYALWTMGRRCQDQEGFLLIVGVLCLVVGQAFVNMAIVTGILPIIGVPLSFISYGGSSLLVASVALGLVFSVYDDECEREEREAEVHEYLQHKEEEDNLRHWQWIRGGKA